MACSSSDKVETSEDDSVDFNVRLTQENLAALHLSPEKEVVQIVMHPLETLISEVGSLRKTLLRLENRFTGLENVIAEKLFTTMEEINDTESGQDSEAENQLNQDAAQLPGVGLQEISSCARKVASVLFNTLNVSNCVLLFDFAFQHKLDSLVEASKRMICEHFYQICESDDHFGELSLDEMKLLAFSDVYATEENVMKIITRWVLGDLNKRLPLADQLLPAIRVSRCSLKFLRELEYHFLVHHQPTFLDNVRNVLKNRAKVQFSTTEETEKWRTEKVLLVLGGNNANGVLEMFSTSTCKWVKEIIPDAPTKRTWIGSLFHLVLVVEEENRKFRAFDVFTRRWQVLKHLPVYRRFMCCAQERNLIYIMGGTGHGSRCDRYDVLKDEWTLAPSMKCGRSSAGAASLKGLVYCSGGHNEPGGGLVSSVEVFNSSEDTWSDAPPMQVTRGCNWLVSSPNFLWCFGDYRTLRRAAVLERYDPTTMNWTRLPDIPMEIYNFSACFCEGLLYVMAGESERNTYRNETLVYNPKSVKWTFAAELSEYRNSHGCVQTFIRDRTE